MADAQHLPAFCTLSGGNVVHGKSVQMVKKSKKSKLLVGVGLHVEVISDYLSSLHTCRCTNVSDGEYVSKLHTCRNTHDSDDE